MATLTHPTTVGMDPEKLEQVQQLFHAQIAQGLHPGAGLAVYRYGHRVLDIHGGVSDVRDGGGATQPVTSQTMFVLMSSTKPLAAACLYLLKEWGSSRGTTQWPHTGRSSASRGRRPSPYATC
jgi:CubicO group peptidase (beta-lactamase class C family)